MFPATSFAVQNITVFPTGKVFVALLVILTGSISVAVALPSSTVLSVSEVASIVIYFDNVVFGRGVYITSRRFIELKMLPASSVAVHSMIVFPIVKVFVALLVILT